MLGASFAAGLCAVGVDVEALGVVPTGCISYVARTQGFGLGGVISASHNPAPDNGIKLMGCDGRKLSEEAELRIERFMDADGLPCPTGGGVGWLNASAELTAAYSEFLIGLLPERLDGMKLAVDTANGAAYAMAPKMLRELGAEVVTLGDEPDGMNINRECGATSPEAVQKLVCDTGADLGISFDGDADRAVFCDETGRLINGDRTMAIWCVHWGDSSRFDPKVVVGTVMSNGGFEQYLNASGIQLVRTPVGDKHIGARLVELGGKIGGEQSGHIIFSEHAPTGDGLVTALELLRVIRREGRPASSYVAAFDNWPQTLINVAVDNCGDWESRPEIVDALSRAEEALAGRGRVVVRASGTQPLIRVMVEADDAALRDSEASRIVAALKSALNGSVYSQVDLTHALGD